jgi:hypothetical protein
MFVTFEHSDFKFASNFDIILSDTSYGFRISNHVNENPYGVKSVPGPLDPGIYLILINKVIAG